MAEVLIWPGPIEETMNAAKKRTIGSRATFPRTILIAYFTILSIVPLDWATPKKKVTPASMMNRSVG